MDTQVLSNANPQIGDINKVLPGQTICIPAACCGILECDDYSGTSPPPNQSAAGVDAGDILLLQHPYVIQGDFGMLAWLK